MSDSDEPAMRPYRCDSCGAGSRRPVKLWRQYATFADHTKLLCKPCAEKDQGEPPVDLSASESIGWLVPAIPVGGKTGQFWGYTSVPDLEAGLWRSLPDSGP